MNSLYIVAVEPNSLQAYRELYDQCIAPDLYSAPWWLDAACGSGGWNAWIHYDTPGAPAMALPYCTQRIRGMSALITPPFTQWVSLIKRTGWEEALPKDLMSCLPVTSIRDLSIKPDALILSGLRTSFTLKYSYIIPAATAVDPKQNRYNEGLKRNIRQAQQDYRLRNSADIEQFLGLCRLSYKAQSLQPPQWLEHVVPAVLRELWPRKSGEITVAESGGNVIAAILTGWDQGTSYYLAGGRIPDDRGASAHALLLDQAIRMAREHGRAFDFEGSMQAGIANFFQSFGAIPSAYWNFRAYRGMGRLWALLK